MNHNHLQTMRENPATFLPWKPGFALIPSGSHVPASELRRHLDEKVFNELFGVTKENLDGFTRFLIRHGYADAADATTALIQRLRKGARKCT